MNIATILKVFMSGPSDVQEEMNSIKNVLSNLNGLVGEIHNVRFEGINWKEDIYSDFGSGDGQQVINEQIKGKYDILIAVFGKKLGTPTDRENSGTVEEINNAIQLKKNDENIHVLIYFNTSPPDNLYDIDLNELSRLTDFKKSLVGLYVEFDSIARFKNHLNLSLAKILKDKNLNGNTDQKQSDLSKVNSNSVKVFSYDKYDYATQILSTVNRDRDDINKNIVENSSIINSAFSRMNNSLAAISPIISELGSAMNEATNEIEKKVIIIKDNRLRESLANKILNNLADNFLDLNKRLQSEVPVLQENMSIGINAYSESFILHGLDSEYVVSANKLKDEMIFSMDSSLELLKSLDGIPPAGSKFNKSKIDIIFTISQITNEMLSGIKLLEQALSS